MSTLLNRLQKIHKWDWFSVPIQQQNVDANVLAGYLRTISNPMDFHTMGEKLKDGLYDLKPMSMVDDFKLICNNALLFHPPKSEFAKEANRLLKRSPWLQKQLQKVVKLPPDKKIESKSKSKKHNKITKVISSKPPKNRTLKLPSVKQHDQKIKRKNVNIAVSKEFNTLPTELTKKNNNFKGQTTASLVQKMEKDSPNGKKSNSAQCITSPSAFMLDLQSKIQKLKQTKYSVDVTNKHKVFLNRVKRKILNKNITFKSRILRPSLSTPYPNPKRVKIQNFHDASCKVILSSMSIKSANNIKEENLVKKQSFIKLQSTNNKMVKQCSDYEGAVTNSIKRTAYRETKIDCKRTKTNCQDSVQLKRPNNSIATSTKKHLAHQQQMKTLLLSLVKRLMQLDKYVFISFNFKTLLLTSLLNDVISRNKYFMRPVRELVDEVVWDDYRVHIVLGFHWH